MVGFENPVMHQGVALEWVSEFPQRFVHDKAMKRPFEKGRGNNGNKDAQGHPGKKYRYQNVISKLTVNV
jgi:hypothetical protein